MAAHQEGVGGAVATVGRATREGVAVVKEGVPTAARAPRTAMRGSRAVLKP